MNKFIKQLPNKEKMKPFFVVVAQTECDLLPFWALKTVNDKAADDEPCLSVSSVTSNKLLSSRYDLGRG